jgi:hypothetical protein
MTTGLLQPVSSSDNPKNFWVMCRIVPGQEPAWLRIVETILVSHEANVDWVDKPEIILARRYVAKDGKMAFGWYVSIIAKSVKDLEKATQVLQMHLEDARPTLTSVTQVPQRAPVVEPVGRALPPGQHPRPRAPDARVAGEALSNPEPPKDFTPAIRIVKKGFDDKGRLETVEEMPLPHVYKELNTPSARGKGAWKDGSFHATGGRK